MFSKQYFNKLTIFYTKRQHGNCSATNKRGLVLSYAQVDLPLGSALPFNRIRYFHGTPEGGLTIAEGVPPRKNQMREENPKG